MAYEVTNPQMLVDDCLTKVLEVWPYKTACCYRAVVIDILEHDSEPDRLIATVEWTEDIPFEVTARTENVWVSSACFTCLLPENIEFSSYWLCLDDNVLVLDSGDPSADNRFLIVGLDRKHHYGQGEVDDLLYHRTNDTVPACAFLWGGFAISNAKYDTPYFEESDPDEDGNVICTPINPNSNGLARGTETDNGGFLTVVDSLNNVWPIRPYMLANYVLWKDFHANYSAGTAGFSLIQYVGGKLYTNDYTTGVSLTGTDLDLEFDHTVYRLCPRTGTFTEEDLSPFSVSETVTVNEGFYFNWTGDYSSEPVASPISPFGWELQTGDLKVHRLDGQNWQAYSQPIYAADGLISSFEIVTTNNWGNGGASFSMTGTADYGYSLASTTPGGAVRYQSGTWTYTTDISEAESGSGSATLFSLGDMSALVSFSFSSDLESSQTDTSTGYLINVGNYTAEQLVYTQHTSAFEEERNTDATINYTYYGVAVGTVTGATTVTRTTGYTNNIGGSYTSYYTLNASTTSSGFFVIASDDKGEAVVLLYWSTSYSESTSSGSGYTFPAAVWEVDFELKFMMAGKAPITLETWSYTTTKASSFNGLAGPGKYCYVGDYPGYSDQDPNSVPIGNLGWVGWTAQVERSCSMDYDVIAPWGSTYKCPAQMVKLDRDQDAFDYSSNTADDELTKHVGQLFQIGSDYALISNGSQWGMPSAGFYPQSLGPQIFPITIEHSLDQKQIKLEYYWKPETTTKTKYFANGVEYDIDVVGEL